MEISKNKEETNQSDIKKRNNSNIFHLDEYYNFRKINSTKSVFQEDINSNDDSLFKMFVKLLMMPLLIMGMIFFGTLQIGLHRKN